MGAALGEVVAFAVAVAISPLPIIIVVLILVSDRARAKGFGFVIGRLLGLALVVGAVLAVAGAGQLTTDDTPSTAASVGRLVVGALLFLLAARLWRNRSRPGEEPPPSALLRRIDKVTPVRAFLLGLLLSVLDPTSLSLAAFAGLHIGQARLPVGQSVTVAAAFILLATVTVTGPLLLYLIGGAAAEHRLDGTKAWLMANEKTVMMVLFLIFGAILIGRGISDLAA